MKRRQLLIIAILLVGFMVPLGAIASDPVVEQLSHTALPKLEEPNINIKELSNGMIIYYLKDSELPVLKIKSYFKTGKIYESKETRGVTDFFMAAWRTGGAKNRSADKIDENIDFMAAKMGASASEELASFDVMCLQKNAQKVLEIYFDLLKNPAFEEDRVATIKKNVLLSIQRRNEEAINIAIREFYQSLFGQDSPKAWMSTPETVSKINQSTLQSFYQDNIAPNQMLMAASSPYEFDDFLKLLDPYLKDWNKKLPEKEWPLDVKKEWMPSIEFIQKEDNQSAIVIGHFGDKRTNPDKYKVILADEVLGGTTFGAKLGDRLRSDLGLVYSIRSNFGFGRENDAFMMTTLTNSEATLKVVEEIKSILSKMVKEQQITEEELKLAKERIINRLVFAMDNPFQIVTQRLLYDYMKYPPNYIALYQKEIEAVTLEDVKEVLVKYFFPDKLKVMIVGDKPKIKGIKKVKDLKEIPLDLE